MINVPEEVLVWLSSYAGYLWLIIAIAFLFFELNTPGLFFFISFALGALFASLFAFMGYSLIVQCSGGLIVSLATFFLLRKYLKKKRMSDVLSGDSETNIDALVGQRGLVVGKITRNKRGSVKIGGEVWQAKCQENTNLLEGTQVTVLRVEGNAVVVKPIKLGDDK